MINIIVRSTDINELSKVKELMHKSLVGSPAYINSEIAICDNADNTFSLIVGNSNDNNSVMNLFTTSGEIVR